MKHAILICIFMLVSASCESGEMPMARTETKEMRTFCVGRHLIDLPKGFEPGGITAIFTAKGMGGDENLSSFDLYIEAANMARSNFTRSVQERRAEIAVAAHGETNLLNEEKSLGVDAVLFRILIIEESYRSELHLLKGGRYIKIRTDSHNGHFLEAEDRLVTFMKNISLNYLPEKLQTSFCLGPVVMGGTYEREYTTLDFRNERRPDIVISVEVNTYAADSSQTLLQRVNGPDSLLKKFDVRNNVLREGELKVAGMRAQEWLSSVKLGENRDEKHLGFALETMRPTPGPTQPHIRLELDTGEHDSNGVERPNSLSDHDAIALWDSIVKTIRLRPVASQ